MLKKILIVLAVLVLLIVGVMAALPSEFAVRSALDVEADQAQVLAHVSDLATWPEWTIWNEANPKLAGIEYSFSENTAGPGAWMAWKHESGDGKLTITRIDPTRGVFYRMDFAGFPPSEGQVGIIQKEKGPLTLSFSLKGEIPFFFRPFRSAMEAEMGREFDRCLANLEKRFGTGD